MPGERKSPAAGRAAVVAGTATVISGLKSNCTTSQAVYNVKGQVVGRIEADTLTKTARAGAHMLQRPPAWAWDAPILAQAEAAGCIWTEITDLDSGKVYRASLADFRRHGVRFDRGHGEQVALPLAYWQVRRKGEQAAAQLSLLDLLGGGR